MSGLEKIRDRILHDAEETADARMKAAEDKARVIKSEAVRDADDIANDIRAKADSDIRLYSERVDSSIDMKHRTGILAAKQEIIGDVIDEAKRRITELSSRDYFDLMLKLMDKHAREGEGLVYFSESDMARMPSGFSSEVMRIAGKNGGSLSISGECRNIGPGFILSYGGIEENCTIDALIAEKKDNITDLVRDILFS